MKAAGGIAAADSSGPLLRAALAEKPDLIKPNRSEMCELMGQPGASDEAIRAYAVRLVADGIPYVLVSLGGDGALLACRDGVWRCKAPDVPVKSTLGCGDTMVASLLLSLLEQAAPAEMLRRAVALLLRQRHDLRNRPHPARDLPGAAPPLHGGSADLIRFCLRKDRYPSRDSGLF